MRRVIAALVVVGLAIGVAVFWPRSSDDPPEAMAETTTTTPTTSTSSTVASTSTTGGGASTTAAADDHTVETVEEAEAILRELWFGWFEGIYNEDEDRIREVVATTQMLEAARNAFDAPFESEPRLGAIQLDLEILYTDRDCLVTWGTIDVSEFRGEGTVSQSVQVLRWVDESWRFTTSWMHRDDLWEADCEADLSPLPPP